MAASDFYEQGVVDGAKLAKFQNFFGANKEEIDAYKVGYEDGKGQRELAGRPVDENYVDWVPAPTGFVYTGEKRVAQDGEYYLTKGGKASKQVGTRKNAQTRHILKRDDNVPF